MQNKSIWQTWLQSRLRFFLDFSDEVLTFSIGFAIPKYMGLDFVESSALALNITGLCASIKLVQKEVRHLDCNKSSNDDCIGVLTIF